MFANTRNLVLMSLCLAFGFVAGCDNDVADPMASTDSNGEIMAVASKATMTSADGVTRYDGVTGGDNIYAFLVPDDWNGDLVLYAHGFIDAEAPLELPTNERIEEIRDRIVEDGFAFAYSSYRENGLAIKDGGWKVAVGNNGTVVRSSDGINWTTMDLSISANLWNITSSGQNGAWLLAVGEQGTVLKSTDTGATWCQLDPETSVDLFAGTMVSNSEYIVGGAGGVMMRTIDGGGDCDSIVPVETRSWGWLRSRF